MSVDPTDDCDPAPEPSRRPPGLRRHRRPRRRDRLHRRAGRRRRARRRADRHRPRRRRRRHRVRPRCRGPSRRRLRGGLGRRRRPGGGDAPRRPRLDPGEPARHTGDPLPRGHRRGAAAARRFRHRGVVARRPCTTGTTSTPASRRSAGCSVPAGRFLAVERRAEPGATGHASHGWTDEQAHLFARRCRTAGFTDTSIDHHRLGRRRVVSVLAHASRDVLGTPHPPPATADSDSLQHDVTVCARLCREYSERGSGLVDREGRR